MIELRLKSISFVLLFIYILKHRIIFNLIWIYFIIVLLKKLMLLYIVTCRCHIIRHSYYHKSFIVYIVYSHTYKFINRCCFFVIYLFCYFKNSATESWMFRKLHDDYELETFLLMFYKYNGRYTVRQNQKTNQTWWVWSLNRFCPILMIGIELIFKTKFLKERLFPL